MKRTHFACRATTVAAVASLVVLANLFMAGDSRGGEITGTYLETRSCQVYTGPCFANAETGLAGRDAIMAWHIEKGSHAGIDLAGLNVVLALRASDLLGFQGLNNARQIQSIILIDDRATPEQREALIDFVRTHAGKACESVMRVASLPIRMHLDRDTLVGELKAGNEVRLETRKARRSDCICSNEAAYYPPLAPVENFAAGVTSVGEFQGRGLGTKWSTPESRSAYMATFRYRS